jgi:signal transduction histidine kinase
MQNEKKSDLPHLFPIIFTLLFWFLPAASQAYIPSQQPDKILIINSYNFGLSWTDTITRTFMDTLGPHYDYLVEFLDSKRYYSPDYFSSVETTLQQKYRHETFKLILVTDNDAYNFILDARSRLFPMVPVVFCGVNNFSPASLAGQTGISGIAENIIIKDTLRIAFRQNPHAKDLYVVVDNTTSGRLFRQLTKEALTNQPTSIQVHYLSELSFEELLEFLRQRADGIVVCFPLSEDGQGITLHFDHAVHSVIANSLMPVYTFWSMFMEAGAVGGFVVSPDYQGRCAAQLAQRILRGESPDDIPVEMDSGNYYTFNYTAMRRFRLPFDVLPAEAIIINRPQRLAETNPQLFLTLLIAGLLLLISIVLMLLFIWRIRNENTRLEQHVAERSQLIHQQEKHLMETEKLTMLGGMVSGIVHEINTPLGVSLTAGSHLIPVCDELISHAANACLTQNQFHTLVGTIRETSQVLVNNINRAGQLVKSFKKLACDQSADDCRMFQLSQCIEDVIISLKHEYKHRPITLEILCPETLSLRNYPAAFIQIFTNLIMNSLVHGFCEQDSGTIKIEVTDENDSIYIVYKDTGRGMSRECRQRIFEPFFTTARHAGGSGLGMSIVHNLVCQRLSGSIEVDSEPGSGVHIKICLPKHSSAT